MNRTLLLLLAGLLTATITHAQDNIVLKNGTEIKAKVLEVSATGIKYRKQDNPDGPIYTSGIGEILLINYANGTKDVLGGSTSGLLPAGQASPSASLLTATQAMTPDGLRYESGWFRRRFTTQSGITLTKQDVRSLLLNQPDALRAFDRGRSLRRWTYITGGAAVVLVGAGAAVAAFGDGGFGHYGNRMGHNDAVSATDNHGPDGMGNDRIGRNGTALVGAALAGTGILAGVAALVLDHRGTVAFRRAANRYRSQPATSLHLSPGYRGMGIGLALRF